MAEMWSASKAWRRPERVGQDAHPDPEALVVVGDDEDDEHAEPDDVEQQDRSDHPFDSAHLGMAQGTAQLPQATYSTSATRTTIHGLHVELVDGEPQLPLQSTEPNESNDEMRRGADDCRPV